MLAAQVTLDPVRLLVELAEAERSEVHAPILNIALDEPELLALRVSF